jgi:hypothetical protein
MYRADGTPVYFLFLCQHATDFNPWLQNEPSLRLYKLIEKQSDV